MAAGESAEAMAVNARKAQQVLERKARYAGKKADDWARGAEGERMVAEALTPLEAAGWRVLHDRRAPDGGNVDHVAIGPPGVAVIDAKRWTASVTITPDRRLAASNQDKTTEVTRLLELADHVRTVLVRDGVVASVRGYLALTGDADRGRPSADLGDVRILGVDALRTRLDQRRGDLSPELVEAVAATLDAALPAATEVDAGHRAAPTTSGEELADVPSPAFEKTHRFYYLKGWKKAGHHRLYLRDRHGTTLGWTDVNTGATTVDCTGDEAKFATALLAAADPTGMKLAPGDLPKVATRLWGGRLLSRIARLHTSVLVGQEWQAFGKRRLYGSLIDPAVSQFELGWVDLKTGERHPASDGPLADDRAPADRYLGFLAHHLPAPRER